MIDAPDACHWVAVGADGRVLFHGASTGPDGHALAVASGHVVVDRDVHAMVSAGGNWRHVGDGRLEKAAPPEISADELREDYLGRLARQASAARARWVRGDPMQLAAYAEKEAEARRFLGGDASACLYLEAEVGITGTSAEEVARKIVGRAEATRRAVASIEALRLRRQRELRDAQDVASMPGLPALDWPRPG